MESAIDLIRKERQRQIDVYGYSDEHIINSIDDYSHGELSDAAACYATNDWFRLYEEGNLAPDTFPWWDKYWKPSPNNRVKELVKAGAMIVAEIDRLNSIK